MEDATVSKSSINEKLNERENQNEEKKRILQKKRTKRKNKSRIWKKWIQMFSRRTKERKTVYEKNCFRNLSEGEKELTREYGQNKPEK